MEKYNTMRGGFFGSTRARAAALISAMMSLVGGGYNARPVPYKRDRRPEPSMGYRRPKVWRPKRWRVSYGGNRRLPQAVQKRLIAAAKDRREYRAYLRARNDAHARMNNPCWRG